RRRPDENSPSSWRRRKKYKNLTFDDGDVGITQADLIAGIDNGSVANGCRVGQIACRNIGAHSNSGVVGARGVAEERTEPAGGVAVERVVPAGGVDDADGVAEERTDPAGGIVVAGGVAQERTVPDSGVAEADDDARQREIGCASPRRDQGRCGGDARYWRRHL